MKKKIEKQSIIGGVCLPTIGEKIKYLNKIYMQAFLLFKMQIANLTAQGNRKTEVFYILNV